MRLFSCFQSSLELAPDAEDLRHPVLLDQQLEEVDQLGFAALRRLVPSFSGQGVASEGALTVKELPWLAGAIVAGGLVGPILLMLGLARTEAATASLLLTLEGVATALIAWFVFHENFDKRIAAGMVCLVGGAIVLSWSGQPSLSGLAGPLAIVGACVAWDSTRSYTARFRFPIHCRSSNSGANRRAGQSCFGLFGRRQSPQRIRRVVRRNDWLSRLWRQSGPVCRGPSPPRRGAHRGLFLDGAISRRTGIGVDSPVICEFLDEHARASGRAPREDGSAARRATRSGEDGFFVTRSPEICDRGSELQHCSEVGHTNDALPDGAPFQSNRARP